MPLGDIRASLATLREEAPNSCAKVVIDGRFVPLGDIRASLATLREEAPNSCAKVVIDGRYIAF